MACIAFTTWRTQNEKDKLWRILLVLYTEPNLVKNYRKTIELKNEQHVYRTANIRDYCSMDLTASECNTEWNRCETTKRSCIVQTPVKQTVNLLIINYAMYHTPCISKLDTKALSRNCSYGNWPRNTSIMLCHRNVFVVVANKMVTATTH